MCDNLCQGVQTESWYRSELMLCLDAMGENLLFKKVASHSARRSEGNRWGQNRTTSKTQEFWYNTAGSVYSLSDWNERGLCYNW